MSLSMKYLFAVAVFAGAFEALSAVWFNAPNLAGQIMAGAAALLFLGSAWAMWARQSLAAASVIGLLLVLDVGGVPFYGKDSWVDWVVQLGFGAIGLVGIIAWVALLRSRGSRRRQPSAARV